MGRIIRKIYFLAIFVILMIAAGTYVQYSDSQKIIHEDAKQIIRLSAAVLHGEIENWMQKNDQVIDDAADFIVAKKWDNDDILTYLTILFQKNPEFSSIYYGTADNFMINASGWKMPPGFDLRTRPWYVKAVNTNQLVYTNAFVNASKDDIIITIAKPVYGKNGNLLGVMGGDVSLRTVLSLVQKKKIGASGFSFLVDGERNMVAHPEYKLDISAAFSKVTGEYATVIDRMQEHRSGVYSAFITGREGYVAYQALPRTEWVLFSFIPMEDFLQPDKQLTRTFLLALAVSLFILLFFVVFLIKYVVRPISLLNDGVKRIDAEKGTGYLFPEEKLGEFADLAHSINIMQDKARVYLNQLAADEQALRSSEERLRAGEARYRALVSGSFEAIALIDVATREIVEVNHRFVELFGYSLPEDSPLFVDQIVMESKTLLDDLFETRLKQQSILQPEPRNMRRKNGTQFTVERAGSLITLDGRNYFMSTMRDMTGERRRQANLSRDVDFASRVQRELLPQLTSSSSVTIRTLYYPAQFVSGDTFHLEWRNDGKILRGFLVDVSGHGLAVAIQTSAVKVLLRETSLSHLPLLGQMRWINSRVAKYFDDGSYAAMLAFELDLADRELRYVGAGITNFYANGKKVATPGMFVGLWEQAEFGVGSMTVAPGDSFYFLTDGFTDSLSQSENNGYFSEGGKNFDADVELLETLGKSGKMRDDGAGICLKVKGP